MFIELVDHLRCLNPHEDICLVASSEQMVGRDIVTGSLGCPVCEAEYPIRGGFAHFGDPPDERASEAVPPSAEQAMRLAAFLDLADPRGFAVLCGNWASHVRPLQALTQVQLLLVNPPPGIGLGGGVSALITAGALPLASGSARAIAFDGTATTAFVATGLLALQPRARILGSSSIPVPDELTELVRDDHVWVAEKHTDPSPVVRLTRR